MARRLPIVLEPAEVTALLATSNIRCMTGLRNRALLETLYRAGLRVGEAVNLRAAHIRWKAHLLEVHDGKGGRDRNVPIEDQHIAWLSAWAVERPHAQHFFCTLKGGRMSVRYVQQVVKRLAHRAKLANADRITPHTLRHSYATSLLDEGFTIREVQALLGHVSVQTTQIYTHVRPKQLAEKIRERHEAVETEQDVSQLLQYLRALKPEARSTLRKLLQELEK